MTRDKQLSCFFFVLALFAQGCGDDVPIAFVELYDAGLTRYVGQFSPVSDAPTPDANGIRHFEFDVPADLDAQPRGPVCLRGTPFQTDVRDGTSDELMIFLEGGGACWEDFCPAVEAATNLPVAGILDPSVAVNPLANHDVVYLPYCDGSLFAGDVDRVLPGSLLGGGGAPTMSYQRGLQNLTAGLDIAAREFPNPSRIVLAGVSGGAFGTITATPLVRFYYPDVDIVVLNDSGVGVAKDGEPEFVRGLITGWNAMEWLPDSCEDCVENGHVTNFVQWTLENDARISMGVLSHARDAVISAFFLMVPAADFATTLVAETGRLNAAFPERYKRFIMPGTSHGAVRNFTPDPMPIFGGVAIRGTLTTEIDGTSGVDWLTAMLDGGDAWVDLVDAE